MERVSLIPFLISLHRYGFSVLQWQIADVHCVCLHSVFQVPVPRSPSKNDAKLPDVGEDSKEAVMKEGEDADAKPDEKAEGDETVTKTEEDAKPSTSEDTAMQDSEGQSKAEDADSKPASKTEESVENGGKPAGESQDDVNGKTAAPEDAEAKKGEEDSIMIPGSPLTLLIKSLSPEISRADLEAVSSSSSPRSPLCEGILSRICVPQTALQAS